MLEHLTNGDRTAAIVFFVALGIVAFTGYLWFILPIICWLRDRHLTPKDGEIWISALTGSKFEVRACESVAGDAVIEVRHEGNLLFRRAAWEWRRFAYERRLYREKAAP